MVVHDAQIVVSEDATAFTCRSARQLELDEITTGRVRDVVRRADELRGLRARRRIDAVGMLRQTFRKRMTDVR